jgi:hypothetical protein
MPDIEFLEQEDQLFFEAGFDEEWTDSHTALMLARKFQNELF